MQPITKQIANMVDMLPQQEQRLVLEIVKRFIPDDVATDNDRAMISAAHEDLRVGRTVKHDDIDWN